MKKSKKYQIHDDLSQSFIYDTPDFWVSVAKNEYPKYYPFCVTDHWHYDVEFVYCAEGSLKYIIEGESIVLHEGEGVFINSHTLHVGQADGSNHCVYYVVILHPVLLCASKYIARSFVDPIVKNKNLKYLRLSNQDSIGNEALHIISDIYENYQQSNGHLIVQALFMNLWNIIYMMCIEETDEEPKPKHHLTTLKDMISYIQQNYTEKISLDEISASGCVGKTLCTSIFSTYVNKTPMEFLRDYRLQQSIELLKNTDYSIAKICYDVGFSSASYYGNCFKKFTGLSPLEYRQLSNR